MKVIIQYKFHNIASRGCRDDGLVILALKFQLKQSSVVGFNAFSISSSQAFVPESRLEGDGGEMGERWGESERERERITGAFKMNGVQQSRNGLEKGKYAIGLSIICHNCATDKLPCFIWSNYAGQRRRADVLCFVILQWNVPLPR